MARADFTPPDGDSVVLIEVEALLRRVRDLEARVRAMRDTRLCSRCQRKFEAEGDRV